MKKVIEQINGSEHCLAVFRATVGLSTEATNKLLSPSKFTIKASAQPNERYRDFEMTE